MTGMTDYYDDLQALRIRELEDALQPFVDVAADHVGSSVGPGEIVIWRSPRSSPPKGVTYAQCTKAFRLVRPRQWVMREKQELERDVI